MEVLLAMPELPSPELAVVLQAEALQAAIPPEEVLQEVNLQAASLVAEACPLLSLIHI